MTEAPLRQDCTVVSGLTSGPASWPVRCRWSHFSSINSQVLFPLSRSPTLLQRVPPDPGLGLVLVLSLASGVPTLQLLDHSPQTQDSIALCLDSRGPALWSLPRSVSWIPMQPAWWACTALGLQGLEIKPGAWTVGEAGGWGRGGRREPPSGQGSLLAAQRGFCVKLQGSHNSILAFWIGMNVYWSWRMRHTLFKVLSWSLLWDTWTSVTWACIRLLGQFPRMLRWDGAAFPPEPEKNVDWA